MNRMKKWAVVLTALLLAMSLSMNAFAATENYAWTETFNGKAITSTFSGSEISPKLNNLQPGDQFDLTVTVSNNGKEATNWYLSNTVITDLEENGGKDGAYGYSLSYNGNTILESDTVSGEGGSGLSEATNATGDVYLGKLAAGETGIVVLSIKLDPQTINNTYIESIARLQVLFAVENDTTVTNVEKKVVKEKTRKTKVVKTGDNSNVIRYVGLAAGALLIMAAILTMIKKNRKEVL